MTDADHVLHHLLYNDDDDDDDDIDDYDGDDDCLFTFVLPSLLYQPLPT